MTNMTSPDAGLDREQLLEIHRYLRMNRLLEERLAALYRQGAIKAGLFRSLGQEGCSVGGAFALEKGDLFAPMIRNIGAVLVRGGRPRDLFAQYLGRSGPTGGRDTGVHYGWISDEGSMLAVISMLGDMIPIIVGALLAERMRGRQTVGLNFIGDGGVSTGAFHEGMNLACVLKIPMILIVENNQYAYSTPLSSQTANPCFVDRARAYGCQGEEVDGTDVLAVYQATRRAAERARRGEGPTLIEAHLYRLAGHTEHDDASYIPPEMREEWSRHDPIAKFERYLIERRVTDQKGIDLAVQSVDQRLHAELDEAKSLPLPDAAATLDGVYADFRVPSPVPRLVREWRKARGEPWPS
jgi:TPP-dependent pyruvate/acetoin dehydrogenase alpha subunit